ncbi:MaoC/PaaZ C-terminal domain-containing protein [Paraburkholderia sp. BL10I2N1]|uniref:MaoC/PaaZ C-terminal domain-containing protein n=1 Tax=Paraburkholderia sp. BL10I2N1 TaxID=1938796 RepID=UPI00105C6574|nr:MaoC/PaaZ C-terminal domain-containing protein [Paraburkholderia sp. BL10I2N1]TDN70571.1 MaoC dehydratase-like protein [Paraburkholderia sp. BL10I2N1]
MGEPLGYGPAVGSTRPKTVVIERLPKPAALYGRALSGLVKRGREAPLPPVCFVRPAVTLEEAAIDRYARVCGFIPEQGMPFTFPHLLAFPLHLLMLTDPAFPWPALGLVHLANSVHLRKPLDAGDVLRVEVEFGALLKHDKGQAFVLHSRLYRRGEAVWDGDSVYLKRAVRAQGDPLAPLDIDRDALTRQARWQLPPQLGRDYAKASGDYNPIHLTALSARAFGFPRAIAHGMWTLARAASALQPPRRLASAIISGEFKLPMLLPGEVSLWTASPLSTSRELEVRDVAGAKPHLRGRFQWTLQ